MYGAFYTVFVTNLSAVSAAQNAPAVGGTAVEVGTADGCGALQSGLTFKSAVSATQDLLAGDSATAESHLPTAELADLLHVWGFSAEAEQAGALHDVDSLLSFGRVSIQSVFANEGQDSVRSV